MKLLGSSNTLHNKTRSKRKQKHFKHGKQFRKHWHGKHQMLKTLNMRENTKQKKRKRNYLLM